MSNIYIKMTSALTLKFFEECIFRNVADDDLESKNNILMKLIQEYPDQVHNICQTNRSKKQIIKDMTKHQKVLYIRSEENNNANSDPKV